MVNILIFRTDRIGDLLLNCPLIISLKNHFKLSKIYLVASNKNSDYAKSLQIFDQVYQFPSKGLAKKINFIYQLSKKKFDYIFIFDGKDRSIISSAFIKSNNKFAITSNKKNNFLCNLLKIKFERDSENTNLKSIYKKIKEHLKIETTENNYDFLNKKKDNGFSSKIPINQYIHIHLDEKWVRNLYIKSYTEINPTYTEFVDFINENARSSNVLITTGIIDYKLILDLKSNFFKELTKKIYFNDACKNLIYFIYKPSFDDLESLLRKSKFLVSCHGAITHAANSFDVKIVDVIERNKRLFYQRFTSYLNNYTFVYRENFNSIKKILQIKLNE